MKYLDIVFAICASLIIVSTLPYILDKDIRETCRWHGMNPYPLVIGNPTLVSWIVSLNFGATILCVGRIIASAFMNKPHNISLGEIAGSIPVLLYILFVFLIVPPILSENANDCFFALSLLFVFFTAILASYQLAQALYYKNYLHCNWRNIIGIASGLLALIPYWHNFISIKYLPI